MKKFLLLKLAGLPVHQQIGYSAMALWLMLLAGTAISLDVISVKTLNNTQFAHRYATGGNGTVGSPWTSASGTGGIQEAITATGTTLGEIDLPAGYYLINTCINATANSATGFGTSSAVNPLIIRGHGKGKTFLVGNTGNCVIDGTGRGALVFKDFTIIRGSGTPSVIGIQLSRAGAAQSQFSENNVIENIFCELATTPTANSNHGTVCGYDFAAEGNRWINDEFVADNPLVLTGDNTFGVTSAYQTVFTGFPLMTQSVISGGFYTAAGLTSGQSILLQGVTDNTRIENVTTEYTSATLIPALRINPQVASPTTPIRNLRIENLQAETPNNSQASQIVVNAILGSPVISGNIGNIAATPIILITGGANGGLQNPEINIFPGNGGVTTPLISDAGAATAGINGGHIFLAGTETIAFTNAASTCNGVVFDSSYASPSITCSNIAGNFKGLLAAQDLFTVQSSGSNTFKSNTNHLFFISGNQVANLNGTGFALLVPQFLTEQAAPSGSAGFSVCYADSTSHTLKCSYNNGSFFNATQTIGSGSVTTAGTAVAAGTCQAQTGITITGSLTTDAAVANINAALPATWQTGIRWLAEVSAAGTCTINLCNPTAGSITPAATATRCTVTR